MKRRKRKKHTAGVSCYGDFLVLLQCCTKQHIEELMETLSHSERPAYVCGKEVPANLNMISYGMLDDLSRIGKDDDVAARMFDILLDIDTLEIYQANVFDVFGFMNFVKNEVNRVNSLFASIKPTHSSDEIAAGINDLNFGTFGVLDWYARRMGITNQDEVFSVPWIRIYTCMKNDNEKNEYESRLHKQYMNKARKK